MKMNGTTLNVDPIIKNLMKLCALLTKSSKKVKILPTKNQNGNSKIEFLFIPTKVINKLITSMFLQQININTDKKE